MSWYIVHNPFVKMFNLVRYTKYCKLNEIQNLVPDVLRTTVFLTMPSLYLASTWMDYFSTSST